MSALWRVAEAVTGLWMPVHSKALWSDLCAQRTTLVRAKGRPT